VTLSVEDNGRGFTPPASYGVLLRRGHVGLLSMRERIERLGGIVQLASAPEAGTTVSVALPVRPDQPALVSAGESP
jgi:signal transduction histidine kinase